LPGRTDRVVEPVRAHLGALNNTMTLRVYNGAILMAHAFAFVNRIAEKLKLAKRSRMS